MADTYFTSDLHFAHGFVALLRGFFSTDAHDAYVCKQLAQIPKDATLVILGDICKGSGDSFTEAIDRLAGLNRPRSRMMLVTGNHDPFMLSAERMAKAAEVFGSISANLVVPICDAKRTMSKLAICTHVPSVPTDAVTGGESTNATNGELYASHSFASITNRPSNAIYLHGHTHAKTPYDTTNPNAINVGLDAWNYRPVSSGDIIDAILLA